MRWHERPVFQTMFVLAVMAGVFSVQNVFVTQLFPQYSALNTSTSDLSKVAAVGGCPVPTLDGVEEGHPTFDPAVAEGDPFNNFGPAIGGLSRASDSKQKFESVIPADKIDAGRIKLGTVLDGAIELVEAMTPSGTYANQNPERPSDGVVIKIKTTPGQVIKAPDSGRKISGSGDRYIGMVMYANADGVRFANSRNDKPTGTEGYNLYIWGINTDSSVVSNYRRGHDEFKRKCFPQFKPGDRLGTAKGDFIYMALRDNGDFVTIRDTSWWDGKVTNGQGATGGGTVPTATPQGGGTIPTATPQGGGTVPTATPQGGGQQGASDVFVGFGTDGNIEVANGFVKIPICWSIKSGKTKANLTTAMNTMGELNLKINNQVAVWTIPILNIDVRDFRAVINTKYQNIADTAQIPTPLYVCERAVMTLESLGSFGAGPSHTFQVVPVNATGLASPVRTETGLLAAPTATPGPGTPTVAAPTATPTGAAAGTPTVTVTQDRDADGEGRFVRVDILTTGDKIGDCEVSQLFCRLNNRSGNVSDVMVRFRLASNNAFSTLFTVNRVGKTIGAGQSVTFSLYIDDTQLYENLGNYDQLRAVSIAGDAFYLYKDIR